MTLIILCNIFHDFYTFIFSSYRLLVIMSKMPVTKKDIVETPKIPGELSPGILSSQDENSCDSAFIDHSSQSANSVVSLEPNESTQGEDNTAEDGNYIYSFFLFVSISMSIVISYFDLFHMNLVHKLFKATFLLLMFLLIEIHHIFRKGQEL